MSLSRYTINFTKWNSEDRRVIATPVDRSFHSFRHAHEWAETALWGMQQADPDSTYEIAGIECNSYTNMKSSAGYVSGIFRTDDEGVES